MAGPPYRHREPEDLDQAEREARAAVELGRWRSAAMTKLLAGFVIAGLLLGVA